ncbi:MAG: metal ABC transporter ATP-binding protein [bacterium]|nr:metal ABC transporter ATP-binding protein [bacterium]
MEKIIEIQNLYFKYEKELVLEDINLEIFEREFVSIIGPNGAGKTTLIKILLNLLPFKDGSIKIFNKDITKDKSYLEYIGYLPQFSTIDKNFPITVKEAILISRYKRKGLLSLFNVSYTEEDKKEVEEIIELLNLKDKEDKRISELSGGQLQKLLLARALAKNIKILILDEPTNFIDPKSKTELIDIILKIKNTLNITVIMVSHDLNVVYKLTDKLVCINKKAFVSKLDNKNLKMKDKIYENLKAIYSQNFEYIEHLNCILD